MGTRIHDVIAQHQIVKVLRQQRALNFPVGTYSAILFRCFGISRCEIRVDRFWNIGDFDPNGVAAAG
jgi:hypothetical protein